MNYKLKDKKSIGGKVISPGITSSWTLIEGGKIKMCEKSPKR
jgi:hypothetical protein